LDTLFAKGNVFHIEKIKVQDKIPLYRRGFRAPLRARSIFSIMRASARS